MPFQRSCHEKTKKKPPGLDGVRDLLRRTLVGLMAVRRATGSDEECSRLLQSVAFDRSSQSQIADATEPVWSLIDPGAEWRGRVWGPTYERPGPHG